MSVLEIDLLASRLQGCPRHHKGQPHKPNQAEVEAVFEDLLGRPQNHAGTQAPDREVHRANADLRTLLEQDQAAIGVRQTFGKRLANGCALGSGVPLARTAEVHRFEFSELAVALSQTFEACSQVLITAAAHSLETVQQPVHLIERFMRGSSQLLVVHLTDQKHLISLLLQRPRFAASEGDQ